MVEQGTAPTDVPTFLLHGVKHDYVDFTIEGGLRDVVVTSDGKPRKIASTLRASNAVDNHGKTWPGCSRVAVNVDGTPASDNMCPACADLPHRKGLTVHLLFLARRFLSLSFGSFE